MSKVIQRNKVNSNADCNHIARGETEEEVPEQAKLHVSEHGVEPTPEHMELVKAHIEDE